MKLASFVAAKSEAPIDIDALEFSLQYKPTAALDEPNSTKTIGTVRIIKKMKDDNTQEGFAKLVAQLAAAINETPCRIDTCGAALIYTTVKLIGDAPTGWAPEALCAAFVEAAAKVINVPPLALLSEVSIALLSQQAAHGDPHAISIVKGLAASAQPRAPSTVARRTIHASRRHRRTR